MANITVLDKNTINKIAAGEVVERPASVVKELLENAIDANATAITVEIKDGGTTFIRVTDNGCGIPKEEIPVAFLRHSTSKIKSVEDLVTISSLGFRGEALSSISAVAQVELITKVSGSLTGARYQIEGGEERAFEDIGAPEGTTFIVRNLFYNTPARQKFLKTPMTEGAHVADIVEKIVLSHPEVSVRFIQNNQNKLHTSGNFNLKDIIYTVFGREIAANLIPVNARNEYAEITGFAAKPVVARNNRNYENYYINGRYIKSSIVSKAIEEAYRPYMMLHKYPFTLLHFKIPPEFLDVNIHPAKMELRFSNGEAVYKTIFEAVRDALSRRELIPQVAIAEDKKLYKKEAEIKKEVIPEPFEIERKKSLHIIPKEEPSAARHNKPEAAGVEKREYSYKETPPEPAAVKEEPKQLDLFDGKLLEPEAREKHKLIGQLFDTYWMVEYKEQLYIIDQHAAHEKVLYEKTMNSLKTREYTSQVVNPPVILTLSQNEENQLEKHMRYFTDMGFEIEHFGGKEYAVRGVPGNLFSIAKKELLIEMIDGLSDDISTHNPDIIYERVASMSCKAAVKGNYTLSAMEANKLIDQLLELENPYACPHGRPTIISMSKYELEKKFKRIL